MVSQVEHPDQLGYVGGAPVERVSGAVRTDHDGATHTVCLPTRERKRYRQADRQGDGPVEVTPMATRSRRRPFVEYRSKFASRPQLPGGGQDLVGDVDGRRCEPYLCSPQLVMLFRSNAFDV